MVVHKHLNCLISHYPQIYIKTTEIANPYTCSYGQMANSCIMNY